MDVKHLSGKEAVGRPTSSLSRLESLPPELRLKFLSSLPDLRTLRSVVHASPTLHAQYRHDRDIILRACLGREFDGFLVDAYATLMSRPHELGSPRTNNAITKFTDSYTDWLSAPVSAIELDSIAPDRLRSMSEFHLSVAQPLVPQYCAWVLTNFMSSAAEGKGDETTAQEVAPDDLNLQRSEEIRVFRAIYRYETYYNLFGHNEGKREGEFDDIWINYLYFSRFYPWEAEAVGCIDLFISEKFREAYERVKDDMYPRHARFRLQGGVYRNEEAFRLTAGAEEYSESILSRGLGTMLQLLSIDDDQELADQIRPLLLRHGNRGAMIQDAITEMAQNGRRSAGRERAALNRPLMVFNGDPVPPDRPPLAWVRRCGGMYIEVYGEYLPESIQRWGYVMWNGDRWDSMGGDELMAKQWPMAERNREYPI